MKNYLIHGVDASRKEFMLDQFAAYGIDNNDVTWLCHPNKNEIEDYMIPGYTTKMDLSKGQISCTIKHYLALKDIVEKGYPYALWVQKGQKPCMSIFFPLIMYLIGTIITY